MSLFPVFKFLKKQMATEFFTNSSMVGYDQMSSEKSGSLCLFSYKDLMTWTLFFFRNIVEIFQTIHFSSVHLIARLTLTLNLSIIMLQLQFLSYIIIALISPPLYYLQNFCLHKKIDTVVILNSAVNCMCYRDVRRSENLEGHCVLKWGFTQTFPGNQDATLK